MLNFFRGKSIEKSFELDNNLARIYRHNNMSLYNIEFNNMVIIVPKLLSLIYV